jgi:hypothetical protein
MLEFVLSGTVTVIVTLLDITLLDTGLNTDFRNSYSWIVHDRHGVSPATKEKRDF